MYLTFYIPSFYSKTQISEDSSVPSSGKHKKYDTYSVKGTGMFPKKIYLRKLNTMDSDENFASIDRSTE